MWKINPDGKLIELSQDIGSDADTDVWVASEEVVFHRAELPPGRQKIWRQTVAFALEDQLLMPVDEQHFVIGQADSGKGIPVAVVSEQLMQTWCDALSEQGLTPRAIWPDVLAVPYEKGRATLWHEGGRCLLRLNAQTGLVGSPEWVQVLLETSPQADSMRIFSDDAAALPEVWRERAEALPCGLDERMLAGLGAEAAALNFLQGAFRPMSPLRAWGMPWLWAGAGMAVAFVLYLGVLTADIRTMNEATASLKQATLNLYKQNFPDHKLVTDLRTQVERNMSLLKGGVDKRRVSPWQTVARVEPLISSCKGCRVEKVKFEKLSVSLVVSSSTGFDDLLQKIAKLKAVKVDSKPLSDLGARKQLRIDLVMEKVS